MEEATFLGEMSGLVIVKQLHFETHTTMAIYVKFDRNFAFLDVPKW